MKAKKPLLLSVLILALLAVALILPATAVGSKPLAFASWGGALANWAPPNPEYWDPYPESVMKISWSVEARQLSPTDTIGHLNMNVVQHPEFPVGVYKTTDIEWSVFSPGSDGAPNEALIVFKWEFPFRPGAVWNLVILQDSPGNGQDFVAILSSPEFLWDEDLGDWVPYGSPWGPFEGNFVLPPLPTNGVQVVVKSPLP